MRNNTKPSTRPLGKQSKEVSEKTKKRIIKAAIRDGEKPHLQVSSQRITLSARKKVKKEFALSPG